MPNINMTNIIEGLKKIKKQKKNNSHLNTDVQVRVFQMEHLSPESHCDPRCLVYHPQ